MAISTQLVAGLSSGFDWRTMIDQIIAVEHRSVDLVENQKTDYESKLEVFQSINTQLLSFKTQAATLASSDAFNVFTSSLSTDSSDYSASAFLSVSTSTSAYPGNHTITMNASSKVAKARHVSSKSFTSYDTALGLEGEFIINGRAVKVETTHDLTDIRDKINNMNSGANATGITASILTGSSSNYRLVLTSDDTGEDAFTIFDASSDAQNVLSTGLGFTDTSATATTVKNLISNGVQSEAFSSSSEAVGSMLGLSTSQSGDVWIGHASDSDRFQAEIDLSQSLTQIAAAINADEDSDATASVDPTTENGVTTYRLKIENCTNFTDENHVFETLGILVGDQSNVQELHLSDTALSEIGGGAITADNTYWTEIDTGGGACNSATGDTITFTGVNHLGTAVSGSYTVDLTQELGLGDKVQVFLDAIESAFADVDEGLYTVSATIDANGAIQIEDDTAGDSQLSLTLTCNNEGGGTLDFGAITASTEGYKKQVQAGQDANIIIDGTSVTSSTNVIDEVIAGVTLNILTVESGSTVDLTISRDNNAIKSSVQTLLDAYNGIMADINEQFAYDDEAEAGGLLQGDSTLFSIKSNLVDIVTSAITGLPTTLNALSLIGITSDDDGNLSIDSDDFADVLADEFNGLRRIFVAEGSTTDGDVEYISHTNDTVAGEFDVSITTAATQATVTGSEDLGGGITSDMSTITITQGSRVAAINLLGAENGSSIENIVNAINSELDAEYAQSVMGSVKMTTDVDKENAISSSTTWSNVHSNGAANTLANNDVIEFSGTASNGAEVGGSYTISNVATDTVQGLLSAIESEFGYKVSAAINTYGYLTVTDNTNRDSSLSINITEPSGKSLDFGAVTTSNLVGSVRLTHDVSGDAIASTDTWADIEGETLDGGEVIYFSGHKSDGSAVEGSYTVVEANALNVFLGAIETAYGGAVDADMVDGRIVLTDGTSNSMLGIEILEPSGGGVDFGTVSGGVTGRYAVALTASENVSDQLVLTSDDYGSTPTFSKSTSDDDLLGVGATVTAGVDVAGTINDEAATGSGQTLTGDEPEDDETVSVEGLMIKYTGTTTGDQGSVEITMGVAELFDRVLYDITNIANGYLDFRIDSMGDRISDLEDDVDAMEHRLDLKMEGMINKFVAMETALSAMQSQSQWLTGQINASYSGWG